MKERLIIKNFGPIKSVDLELGKMTVLIGPSASGKSTILKVLAICRYFSYLVTGSDPNITLSAGHLNTALEDWDLGGFGSNESLIKYENEDYLVDFKVIELDLFDDSLSSFRPYLKAKSDRFKRLLETLYSLIPNNDLDYALYWGGIPLQFLQGEVKSVMNNPFFFPTERGLQSIFSLGKSSIRNLSDTLFNQFALLDQTAKGFKDEIDLVPLGISYKHENGQGVFKSKDSEEFISMSKAASGFKSATPIVLATKYYSLKEKRKRTFLIEEPEQNLFPETQKALVEYLSSCINEFGHSMVLTTHSPYIISSINNLIVANRIAKKENNKVKDIIDEKYWLSINDVSAYCLRKDERGYVSNDLVLEDLEEISIDYLDQVSSEISNVWEKLILLEEEDA